MAEWWASSGVMGPIKLSGTLSELSICISAPCVGSGQVGSQTLLVLHLPVPAVLRFLPPPSLPLSPAEGHLEAPTTSGTLGPRPPGAEVQWESWFGVQRGPFSLLGLGWGWQGSGRVLRCECQPGLTRLGQGVYLQRQGRWSFFTKDET